jgi:hypothetical protein
MWSFSGDDAVNMKKMRTTRDFIVFILDRGTLSHQSLGFVCKTSHYYHKGQEQYLSPEDVKAHGLDSENLKADWTKLESFTCFRVEVMLTNDGRAGGILVFSQDTNFKLIKNKQHSLFILTSSSSTRFASKFSKSLAIM